MDQNARIDAVRERLRELQADEHKAKAVGPPCEHCAHLIDEPKLGYGEPAGPRCGHLAYTERRFDVVKGEFEEVNKTLAEKARAPEGLCGPEAILFEPSTGAKAMRAAGKIFWTLFMLMVAVGAVTVGVGVLDGAGVF